MIKTKAEFMSLSNRGRLGNYLRSWDTAEQAIADGYQGFITIRARAKQSPWFVPVVGINPACWRLAFNEIRDKGGPGPAEFYVQEIPAPGTLRVMNLEAHLTERGLEMTYEGYTTNPLRGIHGRGRPIAGLAAVIMLKAMVTNASWEMLGEIWDEHPTSIIEATEFSTPVGALHQRLVIWEVRDY